MVETMLREVKVKCSECISPAEAQDIIDVIHTREKKWLEWIDITATDDGNVELSYRFKKVPFVRIRRITGYLVGSMDNWNDSKTAEEGERVKHDVKEIEKI